MVDIKKLRTLWIKYPRKEVAKRLKIKVHQLRYIQDRLKKAGKPLLDKRKKYNYD